MQFTRERYSAFSKVPPFTREALAAAGIAMFEFLLVDDRHGLESAMRMLSHSTRLLGRREFVRSGVIEQQERIDCVSRSVRKQTPYGEPVPDPMWTNVADELLNLFHALTPYSGACVK
jgi:hypothetical protein